MLRQDEDGSGTVEEAEMAGLETLLAQGRASGVPGLEMLDARAAKRREPLVAGIGALLGALIVKDGEKVDVGKALSAVVVA